MKFWTIVNQSTLGVKETFGKFTGVLYPGVNFHLPFPITKVRAIDVMTKTSTAEVSIKTKDNVFAHINVAVSHRVNDPERAFYKLQNPEHHMKAALEDVIRSTTPQLLLDELFESKHHIQQSVDTELKRRMEEFGYDIQTVMVTEIVPDKKVKEAMNAINATKRLREAALNEAEAEKTKVVKAAEADCERKRLQGEGIAALRKAIVKGYEQGIADMSEKLGINPKQAMTATLLTQYMDAMERMSTSPNTKTVFIPSGPSAANDWQNDLRRVLLEASEHKSE
jgi:regulator of protease activity HflC (stomatin/prohibitin superfamily)